MVREREHRKQECGIVWRRDRESRVNRETTKVREMSENKAKIGM